MAKHNSANARIKREYFQYLKEAMRRDEASIDAVAKALSRFEESNRHKDFGRFHREHVPFQTFTRYEFVHHGKIFRSIQHALRLLKRRWDSASTRNNHGMVPRGCSRNTGQGLLPTRRSIAQGSTIEQEAAKQPPENSNPQKTAETKPHSDRDGDRIGTLRQLQAITDGR